MFDYMGMRELRGAWRAGMAWARDRTRESRRHGPFRMHTHMLGVATAGPAEQA